MGENQSKPASSNQKPLLGFLNKNSPPKKTSHSLSSSPSGYSAAAQQEQLSPEEVRRRRLAKMEKEEYVPERGLPKDIKTHPIALEFGANAYLIHMNLEDLYLNTFHSSSLSRNPRLRLLQPKDPSEEIRLYTLENMDKTIMAFLQSETYFPGGERLVFLSDLYGRLLSSDQNGLISPEKSQELQTKLVTNLMNFLLNPSACSPGMPAEDLRVVADCSCPIYDALYTKLSAVDTDGFFYKFIGLVPEEHYDAILTPVFKRMIRGSSQNTLSGRFDIQKAIALLNDLLQCDTKIAEFFFNHELFLPKSSKPTGLDFQRNTIFGSFLSFTIMNNDTPSMHEALTTKEIIRNLEGPKQALREKIHDPLNSFHRLIEGIIKLNPTKYKKNILDWFYGALVANKSINGNFSGPNSRLATFGWLTNLLVLLLKLCQKMLEDQKAYPNWFTKIDLNYIYEKPIFEGLNLMNGKTIPKKDPTQESKYTFLTELIFMTSHAWLLTKEAFVQVFEATHRVVALYQEVERNFTPDSLSKENLEDLKIFVAGRTQLVDPYLTRQLHNLLNFQALLILHSYGAQIQDINHLPSIFEQALNKEEGGETSQQGGVLNYWADNIFSYFEKYLAGIEAAAFAEGYDHLELLMNFLLWVISNKKWTEAPLLTKGKAINALLRLLPRKVNAEASFAFLFKDNIYYEKYLVDGLVSFFMELKVMQMSFEPFGPQRQRAYILQIFNYLLRDVFATEASTCYVTKGFEKLFKNSTESYFEFIDTFIDDIVLVLDGISNRLQNKGQNSNTVAQNAYLAQKNDGSFGALLTSIGEYISFAMNLSKNYPEFVVNDLVRERFATSLNYCMKALSQEGILDVKFTNASSQEASFKSVLINLVKIYLNLFGNQEFMNNVKADEKNYNSYYFNKTQVFCEENSNLLTGLEKEQLSQFVASLE